MAAASSSNLDLNLHFLYIRFLLTKGVPAKYKQDYCRSFQIKRIYAWQETHLCLNRWRVNSSFSFIRYMNSKDNLFPALHFICLWRFGYMYVCVTVICVCVHIFCCHLSTGILDKGVLYFFHTSMNNPRLDPKMQFNKYLFPCQGKTHIWEN